MSGTACSTAMRCSTVVISSSVEAALKPCNRSASDHQVQELGDKGIGGVGAQVLGAAYLLNFAFVENDDAVGKFIKVNDTWLQVIGVLVPQASGDADVEGVQSVNRNNLVVAPLNTVMRRFEDNTSYLNDLGFIWADHDMKFEESEKLIRKALDLDKTAREKALKEGKIDEETAKQENAAYLDSLGWVLFKNKKYADAKKYLLESIKDDEERPASIGRARRAPCSRPGRAPWSRRRGACPARCTPRRGPAWPQDD